MFKFSTVLWPIAVSGRFQTPSREFLHVQGMAPHTLVRMGPQEHLRTAPAMCRLCCRKGLRCIGTDNNYWRTGRRGRMLSVTWAVSTVIDTIE